MFERTIFDHEHELFRTQVRRFIETTIAPYHAQWERDGMVPRDLWRAAGKAGLLGCSVPEEYGGAGVDHLFDFVVVEEMARSGFTGPAFHVHNEMVIPYLLSFGTEEQKQQWLPRMVTGEVVGALALTEPAAGSDLRGMKLRAKRDGDGYILSGQKVFISNGQLCDLIVVAAKTGTENRAGEISLFLVESSREGFRRGQMLEKIGLKAQDTSELFFDSVRIPATNLLGVEHGGLGMLAKNLAQERLTQAIRSITVVETVLELTVEYVSQRQMFDRALADFQATQFRLADLKSEAVVGRVLVDRCIQQFLEKRFDGIDAAIAKLWVANLHCRAVDECLQLFGGWGYTWESPIARFYADARIVRIAGGSIEVMKHIIGKSLFPSTKTWKVDT